MPSGQTAQQCRYYPLHKSRGAIWPSLQWGHTSSSPCLGVLDVPVNSYILLAVLHTELNLWLSDLLTMLSSLARLKVLSSEVSRRWAGRICISIEWNVSSCLSLTCLDLFLLLTSAWLYCCCIVCLEVNTIKFVCKKINPLLFLRKFEYLAPLILLS